MAFREAGPPLTLVEPENVRITQQVRESAGKLRGSAICVESRIVRDNLFASYDCPANLLTVSIDVHTRRTFSEFFGPTI